MNGIKYRSPEEMRDSGIEWIGIIPIDWERCRIKYNTYLKGRIGWQGLKAEEFIEEGPYLVTGTDFENGSIKWETCYHILQKRYEQAPEIQLNTGDLLITKDGTIGKLAYIEFLPGKASLNSHLLVIRPVTNKFLNKFLFWVFSSEHFKIYTGLLQGGTIMASLTQEKICNYSFATPIISEQQKIANFLGIKTAQFDSIIAMKEHLIQKLEEAKKSLISEVVTGKVKIMDGDIVPRQPEEMKESGVEWLGMIPKDWEIKKIKHIADVKGRIGFRGYTKDDLVDEDEGALALGATHITVNGIIDVSAPIYIKWKKYFESPEIMLNKGDLLLVQRGSVGRVGIVEDLPKEATINPSLMIIKNFEKVTNRYLFYFLKSVCIEAYFNSITSNTAVPMISQAQALNTWLAIPEVFTQKNIGSFLDIKTAQFDSSIAKNKMLIQKLKQAKQSLISEAVTGKIDLRDWEIMEVGEVQ